jgi:hypothetical protein
LPKTGITAESGIKKLEIQHIMARPGTKQQKAKTGGKTMRNISEDTLVECTMSIDWEHRKMAKEELIRRKGADFYDCFEEAKKSRAKFNPTCRNL